jgi:hypothetical protein
MKKATGGISPLVRIKQRKEFPFTSFWRLFKPDKAPAGIPIHFLLANGSSLEIPFVALSGGVERLE